MPNGCGALTYDIPVRDAACGMPNEKNNSEILKSCCKKAPVETYPNKCGLYCLAIDQELHELQSCLQKFNVGANAFCNNTAGGNATATGTPTMTTSSVLSTETSTEAASKTGDKTADKTSSTTASDPTSTNAAIVPHLSTAGVGVLAMMVCSAVFGAF